jgi:nitrite reductase/ring-hydroxylating ferredoxin subunit
MYTWHKAEGINATTMQEHRVQELLIADKRVAIVKNKEGIFAFVATCPHAGAAFCEGWLDARGLLVCPLHKYRFDTATGRNVSGEGYKLKTYPLEIRNNEIFIGLITT